MNPAYYQISKHLKAYQNQEPKLQSFYSQPLYPDWEKLSKQVAESFKQTEIVDELIAQNQPCKNPDIKKNCEILKEKNTVVVITGQQLGLMLSPLYIIYKTLTTIWLAEKLNREIGSYNFVPVFWLEGEDHDFEEVKSLTFHEMAGSIKSLSVAENPADQGVSMNKRQLTDEISSLLTELNGSLQPTDFSENLFLKLDKIYQPGKNWLEAFQEHMADIFKNTGLLFFNAGSERIKELSKPFFENLLVDNGEIVQCFSNQSKALEKAGYKNQVNIQEGKTYLFLTKNGKRQSLFLKDDIFFLNETGEEFTIKEMFALLEKDPQWISSTVLSRPLWQSYMLPVVSYVAGGAEISYWGQLKSGFEKMDIVMPHLQPRHSITLIEPKTERLLNKYEMDITLVPNNKDIFLKEYFAKTHLSDVTDTLTEFEQQVEENKSRVIELIKSIDPTLMGPTEKSFSAIIGTINKLHNRFSSTISTKESTIQKHLNSIHESVLPNGILQERLISSVYFENKYGPEWINKIMEQLNENFLEHLIVRL